MILSDLWEDDSDFIPFKAGGVGTGHSKSGTRKSWKKRFFFEQDLVARGLRILGKDRFQSKYAGCSQSDIDFFWEKIERHVIRPRESKIHARNKLLLWLDKVHNDLSWRQVSDSYQIGVATAIQYVHNLLAGFIKAYKGTDVISFPNAPQRMRMVSANKQRGKHMPHALYTMDGKHARCRGSTFPERMSPKYKGKHAYYNCLFLVERCFGTICAYNLDEASTKHDLDVLRESAWFQNLEQLADGWIIMCDKGYVGVEALNVAATARMNMGVRKQYSPHFWRELQLARGDSERIFSHFFVNKFKQLSNWSGKGPKSFRDWALNVTCGIIVYNELKLRNAKPC